MDAERANRIRASEAKKYRAVKKAVRSIKHEGILGYVALAITIYHNQRLFA
jgi:hypothetical protein